MVATGFEPLDILQGVLRAVDQLEDGQAYLENAYARAVTDSGEGNARRLLETVFEPATRPWRGLGEIPNGALSLRPAWQAFDAEARFALDQMPESSHPDCQAAAVLTGRLSPTECPAFAGAAAPSILWARRWCAAERLRRLFSLPRANGGGMNSDANVPGALLCPAPFSDPIEIRLRMAAVGE